MKLNDIFKETGTEGVDWIRSGYAPMKRYCDDANEPSCSTKEREIAE
jgi:hypothetical protein